MNDFIYTVACTKMNRRVRYRIKVENNHIDKFTSVGTCICKR